MAVIDISNPSNPSSPIYENTTGTTQGVHIDGDFAYIADELSGVAIVNITNPTNPEILDYEDTIGDAKNVFLSGDYAYVADSSGGLAVIQVRRKFDTVNPIIIDSPIDFEVEFTYSSQSISWTAIDTDPNHYTIELQDTGTVAGPNNWESNQAVTYNIPDGLFAGIHIYTITFTDDNENSIAVSVAFTVNDKEYIIPGASFELTLIFSICTVVSIIISRKKKQHSKLK